MQETLNQVYFDNTIREYLTVVSIILVSVFVLWMVKKLVIKSLRRAAEKTSGKDDDIFIDSADRFALPIIQFAVIYWALTFLELSARVGRVIEIAITVIITYFVIRLLSSIIMLLLHSNIRKREHGETKIKELGGLMLVINIFIWIVGILFLLDNMGKDVTAIVTGLGIGGIAIALAAQNILGDLFNYFVIYFDRPFEVGDFIVIDDKMGTVEYLGIKTSRIRSLSGEQLIFSNSNLTSSRIHNFKRMLNRRIVFGLNVDYRTPREKIKMIPGLLKSIVLEQQMVKFDRAHFASYGDWALRFEVVFIVLDADFNRYMDIQQEINFRILDEFERHDIFLVTSPHISLMPTVSEEDKKANRAAVAQGKYQ